MQKKVNILVRLHEEMQEKSKTASYSKPIQILTMVPDECTVQNISISLNSLFVLHMKSKKQVIYQQNLFLKKGKTFITETLHLVTNAFENDNFSKQVLEKKDYVSVSKEYIKKLELAKVFVTCKSFILLSKKNSQM